MPALWKKFRGAFFFECTDSPRVLLFRKGEILKIVHVNWQTLRWVGVTLIFALITAGCQSAEISPNNGGILYVIDNRFLSLYNVLGGEDILGPAISPIINIQGIDFQFTTSALFEYNPTLPVGQQVKLSPIGSTMGIAEHFGVDREQSIAVYPGFLDLYSHLGGERFVGSPITNVIYNNEKSRLEQHFDNLGFYQSDSDASSRVQLLDYGVWMCANMCEFSANENSEVILFSQVMQPFMERIHAFSPEIIGRPLTNPQIAPDGQIEQIFQNIVFTAAANNPSENFHLRPLPSLLGIPIQSGISHEIPVVFVEYLESNFNLQFAGAAVTPLTRLSDYLYRQCFQNMCIDYFPFNSEGKKIKPVPLGYLYRDRHHRPAEIQTLEVQPRNQSSDISVWEEHPLLPPNTSQIIGVQIQQDQIPIENIEPSLILRFPERISITFSMPPTNADGSTTLTLYPIDAPHGTVISYDVCVNLLNEVQTCQSDNFIIWGDP